MREGRDVRPTRGPARVCTFKQVSRVLAGFPDGLADEGVGAGPASLEGLRLARQHDWTAPDGDSSPEQHQPEAEAAGDGAAPGRHDSTDSPANAPDEKPGEGATAAPVELSAGIPPLMARLRRLQAEAHAREHPDEAGPDRQEGDEDETDVASPPAPGGRGSDVSRRL